MAIPDLKLDDILQAELRGPNLYFKKEDKEVPIQTALNHFISLLEKEGQALDPRKKLVLFLRINQLFSPSLSESQQNLIRRILLQDNIYIPGSSTEAQLQLQAEEKEAEVNFEHLSAPFHKALQDGETQAAWKELRKEEKQEIKELFLIIMSEEAIKTISPEFIEICFNNVIKWTAFINKLSIAKKLAIENLLGNLLKLAPPEDSDDIRIISITESELKDRVAYIQGLVDLYSSSFARNKTIKLNAFLPRSPEYLPLFKFYLQEPSLAVVDAKNFVYNQHALELLRSSPELLIKIIKNPHVNSDFVYFAAKRMPAEQVLAYLELIEICPEANRKILNKLITPNSPLLEDPQNVVKLGPLILWIRNQWQGNTSETRHQELMLLLDKAIAFQLDSPALTEKLFQLPHDKLHLWEAILSTTDVVEDITEQNVREILTKAGEKDLLFAVFDDYKDPNAIYARVENYFSRFKGKKVFEEWIDRLLKETAVDYKDLDLRAKIAKLGEQDRQTIKKITLINDPFLLDNVLEFALSVPYPLCVAAYLKGCNEYLKKPPPEASSDSGKIQVLTPGKDRTQTVLYTVKELAIRFPHLLSRFFIMMKNNDSLLLALGMLQPKPEDIYFEYFIDRYIGNSVSAEKATVPAEEYLRLAARMVKEPAYLQAVKRTIDIERTHNTRFHVIFKPIEDTELLDYLEANRDFAAKYLRLHLGAEQTFVECFKKDRAKMIEIINLTANYPSVCKRLLNTIIQENRKDKLTDLYDQLLVLSRNPANKIIFNRMLQSLETNYDNFHWEFAELIKNNDLPILDRLLDMEMHSGHDVVKGMFYYYERRDVEHYPLARKMLAAAGSKNMMVIREMIKIINLGRPNPFIDMFKNEEPDSPLLKNLLILRARNERALLKCGMDIYQWGITSDADQQIIKMIEAGNFTLAKQIMVAPKEPFNAALLSIPNITQQQQVRDLHKSIHSLPAEQAEKYSSLVDFAIYLCKSLTLEHYASEWMSRVQFLLVHDPESLDKLCQNELWINCSAALQRNEDPEDLVDRIMVYFPLDISAKLQEILETAGKECGELVSRCTPLSIAISRCLLTPGGTLNLGIIDTILEHLNKPSIQVEPVIKNYIRTMLRFMQQDYDFSQRLEACREPPAKSDQRLIIQKLLGLKDDSQVDKGAAQLAILSALLWPTRQGNVGSCFATSEVIRMNSFPDGAKQTLEDLLSIVAEGCIVRKGKKYTLYYDKDNFFTMFTGEHFLSRAREYLIARMYEGEKTVQEGIREKVTAIVAAKLADLKLPESYLQKVKKIFDQSSALAYAPKAGAEKVHTWRLINIFTGEPFDRDMTRLETFVQDAFELGRTELDGEYTDRVAKMIKVEKRVAAYVKSTEFWGDLIHAIEADKKEKDRRQKGLARVDPLRYGKLAKLTTLFAEESPGGHRNKILEAYFNVPPTSLKMHVSRRPIESVLLCMKYMSEAEKEAANRNPTLLKCIDTSDHAFNIRIGHIMKDFDEEGLEKFIEGTKKTQSALMQTPVTSEISDYIVPRFISYFGPLSKIRYNKALAAAMEKMGIPLKVEDFADQARFNKAIAEGLQKMDKPLHLVDFANLAVNTLCLITGEHASKWAGRQAFMRILCEMPQFQKMISFISIMDTNWEPDTTLETGVFVDPAWEQIVFRKSGNLTENTDWSPGMAHEWNFHLFDSLCDDISRFYWL